MSELASRLKAVRSVLGLSQAEISRKTGIAAKSWSNYEVSGAWPGGKVLLKLYQEGIDINWLLSGSGEMLQVGEEKAHTIENDEKATEDIRSEVLKLAQVQAAKCIDLDTEKAMLLAVIISTIFERDFCNKPTDERLKAASIIIDQLLAIADCSKAPDR